ncbi:Protein spaetzle 3 [Nymphon striatum]|nr:Protein spaetzle 3 [Nymphon striatum]
MADMHLAYGSADGKAKPAAGIEQERYPNRQVPDHRIFSTLHRRTKIDMFIDENKSLLRRMYGEFPEAPDETPPLASDGYGGFNDNQKSRSRYKRSQSTPRSNIGQSNSDRIDSCESAVEIVTPYWASNSAAKIRAIVNTQHFEQAIQQEVCQKDTTKRCKDDCSCEQKYKWHRLLAYDPDDECKGIFMDWFLFPSCCVCRCNKNPLEK